MAHDDQTITGVPDLDQQDADGRAPHRPDAGAPGQGPDREAGGGVVTGDGRVVSHDEHVVTGDDPVDEALTALDGLPDRPVREHVAAFDAVHGALADRLAETQA